MQNLSEIGQSAAELRQKTIFKRRLSAVLNFLRTVFGHMAIIELEHRDHSSELLTF